MTTAGCCAGASRRGLGQTEIWILGEKPLAQLEVLLPELCKRFASDGIKPRNWRVDKPTADHLCLRHRGKPGQRPPAKLMNHCHRRQCTPAVVFSHRQIKCSFCDMNCNLELPMQGNQIVKCTSPNHHETTRGNLCIKRRLSWSYV